MWRENLEQLKRLILYLYIFWQSANEEKQKFQICFGKFLYSL